MMCEVFVLAAADLVGAREITSNGRASPPGWSCTTR